MLSITQNNKTTEQQHMIKNIFRNIIEDCWKNPTKFINEEGKMETHICLLTCIKCDSVEPQNIIGTKNMNKDVEYGCPRCNDLTVKMMDPERYSHLYPRGVQQQLAIAESCKTTEEWSKDGKGYTPLQGEDVLFDHPQNPDPAFIVTTDLSHAAKNLFQQLFGTTMALEPIIKQHANQLFTDMVSICHMNNIPNNQRLTMKNWSGSPGWVKDITLEIAPIALVKRL